MSTADDTFLKQFGLILAILFFFMLAMIVLANGIGGPAMSGVRNSASAVQERIARVGSVRLEGDAVEAAAPAAMAAAAPAAAVGGGKSGEEVYNLACIACHASGAAGAPIVGDEAAWIPRAEQGLDLLVGHAINGKGAMPAKGGIATLSDDEVANAVKWMLDETGIPLAGAAPAAAESAAAESAAAEAPAAAEAGAAAEEPVAAAVEEAKEQAPAAQAAEEVKTETVAAAPAAEEAKAAPAAAEEGKPGDEVYSMGCIACHMSGAAGAPKVGDTAAWKSRAAAGGVDALIQAAINGKGVMPAKGGLSFLSDADVGNAVRHMLSESGIE